ALPAGSHSSVVEFGARAELAGSGQSLPGASTDLSAALKLAGTVLARDPALSPELVLLTDGWPTAGGAPLDSAPGGVPISYVPLPPAAQSTVAVIHTLKAPNVARVGDRIDVQLDLQAIQSVDANLRLTLNQSTVANGTVHLE